MEGQSIGLAVARPTTLMEETFPVARYCGRIEVTTAPDLPRAKNAKGPMPSSS